MTLVRLQQFADCTVCQWMVLEPLCPVDQVAIVGTGHSPDFDMPADGSRGMSFECIAGLGFDLPPFVVVHCPIFSHNPVHILVRMPTSCPGAQDVIEDTITVAEGLLGYHASIVVRPAHDLGVE